MHVSHKTEDKKKKNIVIHTCHILAPLRINFRLFYNESSATTQKKKRKRGDRARDVASGKRRTDGCGFGHENTGLRTVGLPANHVRDDETKEMHGISISGSFCALVLLVTVARAWQ